jgi:dienelactone hydrolase
VRLSLLIALALIGCAHTGGAEDGSTLAPEYPPPPPALAEAPAPVVANAEPAAAPPAPAAPTMETKEVDYQVGAVKLKGFIAYPTATAGKRPGVLVVHEWWGPNDYVRMRATKLAELGYVAMAVDMYGDGKIATHPDDAQKFMAEVLGNMRGAEQRFEAARTLIASDPRVDAEKIAAIGYCFGGGVVLHMARIGAQLDAVASFHGMLGTDKPMKAEAFAGQIFVAQGAADPFVPPEQVAAFKHEMDKAKAHYEVVEYAGAKHGFTNPAATENGTKFQLPLAYDAAADAASWQKLTELLASVWSTP